METERLVRLLPSQQTASRKSEVSPKCHRCGGEEKKTPRSAATDSKGTQVLRGTHGICLRVTMWVWNAEVFRRHNFVRVCVLLYFIYTDIWGI